MSRTKFSAVKQKALADENVRKEYDTLETTYELRKSLIALRQKAGLTQEQIADLLHTKKSNISRLENVNSEISPKLSTIEQYANAMGYKIKISFEPRVGSLPENDDLTSFLGSSPLAAAKLEVEKNHDLPRNVEL